MLVNHLYKILYIYYIYIDIKGRAALTQTKACGCIAFSFQFILQSDDLSQAKPMVHMKETGTLACCQECADVVLSIRPGGALPVLISIYKNESGEVVKDPSFARELKASLDHRKNNPVGGDVFKPESTVVTTSSYSYNIFQDLAAVTEAEYVQMTGRSPDHLKFQTDHCKLEPMKVPFFGPASNATLYGISLMELPEKFRLSVRKARVSFGTGTTHEEAYLTPQRQLHADQGAEVFSFVTRLHQETRPAQLKMNCWQHAEAFNKHPKLDDLRQRHEDVEAEAANMQNRESQVGQMGKMALAAGSESDEEENPKSVPARPLGLAGGSLGSAALKQQDKEMAKEAKRRAKTIKAAKAAAQASQQGAEAEDAQEAPSHCSASHKASSRSKKQNEAERILAGLDTSLTEVAEKHLQSGGSSLASLEGLTSLSFLLGGDGVTPKTCSSNVMGAKKIVDALRKTQNTWYADVLQQRIDECENALNLRLKADKGLNQVPLLQVKAHINLTKELWPQYPLPIQVKLVLRFIFEDLQVAHAAMKGGEDGQVEAWVRFGSRLCFDASNVSPTGFKEGMSLPELLATLLSKSESSAGTFASQDDDLGMDVDAAMEAAQVDRETPQHDGFLQALQARVVKFSMVDLYFVAHGEGRRVPQKSCQLDCWS